MNNINYDKNDPRNFPSSYEEKKFACFVNILEKHKIPVTLGVALYACYMGGFIKVKVNPINRTRYSYFIPFSKKNVGSIQDINYHINRMIVTLNNVNHNDNDLNVDNHTMHTQIKRMRTVDHRNAVYNFSYQYISEDFTDNLVKTGQATTSTIEYEFVDDNRNIYIVLNALYQFFAIIGVIETPSGILNEIFDAWKELLNNEEV